MNTSRPKYLFDHLDDIRQQLTQTDRFALFLDLDGTLAALAPTPQAVTLKPQTRLALEALVNDQRNRVAVVSGRAVDDLKTIVELPGIIYVGNHGLEVSGLGLEFIHSEASARTDLIKNLCATLKRRLSHIAGAIVEFKILTASVHYRLAAPSAIPEVFRTVDDVMEPVRELVCLSEGNRVLELRPTIAWHKGTAVQWILGHLGYAEAASVYVGDDRTDEDAFIVLTRSITIHVGVDCGATAARFFVRTPDGVLTFLQCLPAIQPLPFGVARRAGNSR